MATVNSANKMQGLLKGDLFFGLKFGVCYFKFQCKDALISGKELFVFRVGEMRGILVEFYGYVTKHNYSFQ